MNKIILTALDDNDEIWYECFIPFIVSLEETDYNGDIGVISYGLSNEKEKVLEKNNIKIFKGKNKLNEILLDRHIEIGEILEEYNYDQCILYDVDIWFPSKNLTIFDIIKEDDKIYCTHDAIVPDFLLNGIEDIEIKNEIKEKLLKVYDKEKSFWQIGVMAGTKKAWVKYREFILETLKKLENCSLIYGIDTTMVNLYDYEYNNVSYLPQKYNCLPFFGIEITNTKKYFFYVKGEYIEGIHVTRFHREKKDFLYRYYFKDVYYEKGRKYIPFEYNINEIKNISESFSFIFEKMTGNLNEISVEKFTVIGEVKVSADNLGTFYTENSLIMDINGETEIIFKNKDENIKYIYLLYSGTINKKLYDEIEFYLNGDIYTLKENYFFKIPLEQNETFKIVSKDLDIKNSGMRLVLANIKFV